MSTKNKLSGNVYVYIAESKWIIPTKMCLFYGGHFNKGVL